MTKNTLQFTGVLTKEFFQHFYNSLKMNYREITEMLNSKGIKVKKPTVKKYGKMLGFGRSRSECKRKLDWSVSHLDKSMRQMIDGLVISDGHLSDRNTTSALSASLKHAEFRNYLSSLFACYEPCIGTGLGSGRRFYRFCTKSHPDLYNQRLRWYKSGKKIIPKDIIITPLSVMIWYLGDGTFNKKQSSITLCTNGFKKSDVEFLVGKLCDKGIVCNRTQFKPYGKSWGAQKKKSKKRLYHAIHISLKGIPVFFNYIGLNCPVKCYKYKFDIPNWLPKSVKLENIYKSHNLTRWRFNEFIKKKIKDGFVKSHQLHKKGRIWIEKKDIVNYSMLKHQSFLFQRKKFAYFSTTLLCIDFLLNRLYFPTFRR